MLHEITPGLVSYSHYDSTNSRGTPRNGQMCGLEAFEAPSLVQMLEAISADNLASEFWLDKASHSQQLRSLNSLT